MVTCTANDGSSELISCVRRGPFAVPDENERVEYLLSRKRTVRAPIEKHAVLHVLSYQRRLNAIKNVFFARGSKTPLGEMREWWDRLDLSSQTCAILVCTYCARLKRKRECVRQRRS